MTPLDVVAIMAGVGAIGVAVDSAEVLTARRALAPTGVYSWEVLGAGRRYLVSGLLARPLGRLFGYPHVLVLPVLQLVAVVPLLVAWALPEGWMRLDVAVAATTVALARVLFYMRQQLGLDGADQMIVVVMLACGGGALLGDTLGGWAAVCYAAFQLLMSYAVSGVAKAVSPSWRSGRAIVGITNTMGYGQPRLHRLLVSSPRSARLVCWTVIGFECGAPLLLLGGRTGVTALVVAGTCFHLGVAVVMGLNTFLWAFVATYPSVFLVAGQLPDLPARLTGH